MGTVVDPRHLILDLRVHRRGEGWKAVHCVEIHINGDDEDMVIRAIAIVFQQSLDESVLIAAILPASLLALADVVAKTVLRCRRRVRQDYSDVRVCADLPHRVDDRVQVLEHAVDDYVDGLIDGVEHVIGAQADRYQIRPLPVVELRAVSGKIQALVAILRFINEGTTG